MQDFTISVGKQARERNIDSPLQESSNSQGRSLPLVISAKRFVFFGLEGCRGGVGGIGSIGWRREEEGDSRGRQSISSQARRQAALTNFKAIAPDPSSPATSKTRENDRISGHHQHKRPYNSPDRMQSRLRDGKEVW